MIELKRHIRPALIVSVIAHAGILAVGPLLLYATALEQPPPQPDAMVVEVVTSDQIPQLSGTPSTREKSGSETSSPSNKANNTVNQSPPPRPRSPPEQEHARPEQQAQAKPAERPLAPEATSAELVRAEKTEPDAQKQTVAEQAAPPQPEEPHVESNAADKQYASAGPPGGGYEVPPLDAVTLGYDFMTVFRERLMQCSKRMAGMSHDITVKIHFSFNRDGTLAAPVRLAGPAPSAKHRELFESAVYALETCQPFTMLPPDRYKEWKTMSVNVYPINTVDR